MKHEGTLAEHDLAQIVQSLYETRGTGLLVLTRGELSKSLTVDEGRIVFAASSNPDERLGALLLRRGRLTLREFTDALAQVAPGRRLGAVLVAMGVLEPSELADAISDHTREIVYGAFLWEEGHYSVQEGPPTPELIKLNVRTPDLIMGGIGRIETWSRIDGALGGVDALYDRAPSAARVTADMTLSAEKRDILASLDHPRSVGDICEASALPDIEVCRVLWAFRVLGVTRPLGAPEASSVELDDDGLGMILSSE